MDDSDAFVSHRDLEAASMRRKIEALNDEVLGCLSDLREEAGGLLLCPEATAWTLADVDALEDACALVRGCRDAFRRRAAGRDGRIRRADGGTRL